MSYAGLGCFFGGKRIFDDVSIHFFRSEKFSHFKLLEAFVQADEVGVVMVCFSF